MSDSGRFVALLMVVTVWFMVLTHRVGDLDEKVDRIEQAVTTRPAENPK